jgi:hypothetical protein
VFLDEMELNQCLIGSDLFKACNINRLLWLLVSIIGVYRKFKWLSENILSHIDSISLFYVDHEQNYLMQIKMKDIFAIL